MAMKEESGVLEVDYRSEGSGVEVSVLFELEVSGKVVRQMVKWRSKVSSVG